MQQFTPSMPEKLMISFFRPERFTIAYNMVQIYNFFPSASHLKD